MKSHATVSTPISGSEELICRVRELIPGIAARAAQGERDRQVAAETIAAIRDAGLFRILQPRRWGGYELDLQTFFAVQMAIAEGDMSTGWV
ncbi:MAG: hypothetical protein EXR28_06390 [Betaproteobacteria bacterium]|nr:hypothetical protein [Betaproteobacteria bacterium]